MKNPQIIGEVRTTAEQFLTKKSLNDYDILAKKVAEFNLVATLE
jgi:hypothetical protein